MKNIRRAFAICVLLGSGTLMLGLASPAEAARSRQAPGISKNDAAELATCDLYKARDMCCPVWCGGKEKSVFEAAKALSGCAKGYSCDWSDSPSQASFQCGGKCK